MNTLDVVKILEKQLADVKKLRYIREMSSSMKHDVLGSGSYEGRVIRRALIIDE